MTNDPCPHCGYCPHCKRSTRDFAPYVPYVPTVVPQPWVYPYWQHPVTITCGDTMTTAPAFPNTTTYLMNPASTVAANTSTCVGIYGLDSTTMSYEHNPDPTVSVSPCDHGSAA